MLHHFLAPLAQDYLFFNLFTYITFRSILAALFSLIISVVLGRYFINYMSNKINEVRKLTPESHLKKAGTPSMGGIVILVSLTFSVLLTANFDNYLIIFGLLAFWGFGLIGLVDDLVKIKKNGGKGLSVKVKLGMQVAFSMVIVIALLTIGDEIELVALAERVSITYSYFTLPFLKEVFFDLSYYYVFFGVFVLVASSNAVNLTDGLDGLAIGLSLLVVITFVIFSYVSGNFITAEYLQIPYIKSTAEYTVFLAALIGAGLGFLWYNAHPAQMFMGDTGSLALGGIIGFTALVLKQELLLPIVGGIFVVEALSVIVQVSSYKATKKRVFLMAPIHHHFELLGIKESKIIARFWIVGIILVLASLATLKIR